MLTFRVDKARNALFVTLSGVIQKDQIAQKLPEMLKACHELKARFSIITDLTLAKDISPTDLKIFGQVAKKIYETFEIKQGIRILGTSVNYIDTLKAIDKTLENETIHYVYNRMDAMKLLGKK